MDIIDQAEHHEQQARDIAIRQARAAKIDTSNRQAAAGIVILKQVTIEDGAAKLAVIFGLNEINSHQPVHNVE